MGNDTRILKTNREIKKVYSISLHPSFHLLAKTHALMSNTTLSRLLEEIVWPELVKRENLKKRYNEHLSVSISEAMKERVLLSKDTMHMLKTYKGCTSANEAAELFISKGLSSHNKMEHYGNEIKKENTSPQHPPHKEVDADTDYLFS